MERVKKFMENLVEKIKIIGKKAFYYIQLIDGIWSVPLGFFLFFMCGYLLSLFFGYTVGFYDPSFIQPLFLAATVVIGATNVAVGGLYFTFRGLYRYLYGERRIDKETGKKYIVNYSKKDWENLLVWQRYLLAFFVFFFFVLATIIVYLKLV